MVPETSASTDAIDNDLKWQLPLETPWEDAVQCFRSRKMVQNLPRMIAGCEGPLPAKSKLRVRNVELHTILCSSTYRTSRIEEVCEDKANARLLE